MLIKKKTYFEAQLSWIIRLWPFHKSPGLHLLFGCRSQPVSMHGASQRTASLAHVCGHSRASIILAGSGSLPWGWSLGGLLIGWLFPQTLIHLIPAHRVGSLE